MVTDEMVEKAAVAMCLKGGFAPYEAMPNDGPRWKYYVDGARAALEAALSAQVQDVVGWEKREREARAKALEEAAKVAEDKAQAWSTSKGGEIDACLDTAAAIRALQSEEP